MESATSHLASCVTCAAAAREIAEEATLLESALAPEFDVNVPTAVLRERIDAAVLGERVANASRVEKPGLFASLANVFSFNSQRTLGYASLVVVIAFGAIIGIVKYRQEVTPQTPGYQATAPASNQTPISNPSQNGTELVASKANETGVSNPAVSAPPASRPTIKNKPRTATPRVAPVEANHIQLLPGERSYLQAIARLDSTIKQNKNAMRPSLQVEYERNLAVVDRAIAATRNAAKSNPNDPDAADFMFAAYQSKVDLLNTIADARLGGGRPR